MGIRDKIKDFKEREKIEKQIKYKVSNSQANHLTGTKKEKLYEYYKCDYCGDEIKIEKDFDKRLGGTVVIPDSITRCGSIKLALCNKCLNPILKEFEEMNDGKNNNI